MSVYLISYDLNKIHKDYRKIILAIGLVDRNHYHVLKSQWLVNYHKTSSDLNEILRGSIDKDDDLLIVQVTQNYAGIISNADKLKAWLDKNL